MACDTGNPARHETPDMIDTPIGDIKVDDMKAALRGLSAADFAAGGRRLFATLGYQSDRVLSLSGDVGEFFATVKQPQHAPQTQSERRFKQEAQSIHLLFQLTTGEIAAAKAGQQGLTLVMDSAQANTMDTQSFVFMAAQLRGDSYSRARYADFVREINKHLRMPVVALFRTANGRVTLSFVYRRKHKLDPGRDVLGRVSLLREINANNPHRAHIDILQTLALQPRLRWIENHGRPQNFDGLLAAWLAALDTQELNKKFYLELYGWFGRAVQEAEFPEDSGVSPEEHVMRLITRLLFIWFIKEKGLVADDLFIENKVKALLKNYDHLRGDSYYRAVLQNLFFAVLNTELDKRAFSEQNNSTHRDFSRYRYRGEMSDPEALLALFNQSPFINGGLFDCLDSFEGKQKGGRRIDCFTDNRRHRAGYSIPNRLFFGDGGLIKLLERYKFTVEENTPVEQEVALDPELLGKAFENLLAAQNPETRENARKQSGSFYTPRVVVDYMVDQSLLALLEQKVSPEDGDAERWQARLQSLLDYESADAPDLFTPKERERLTRAVAETKIIDPAVGSGAFPMGILHKLTLVLRRLDPDNSLWRAVQEQHATERAGRTFGSKDNQRQREEALAAINDLFERYSDSDFGRKLYLIQKSIFGVDKQTTACQIAKLRFFISLAIEQRPNSDKKDNYGIKPLPNLETCFVAADTLLGLNKSKQQGFQDDAVVKIEEEIRANDEQYFHATDRRKKLRCISADVALRKALSAALQKSGWGSDSAEKISKWERLDQNAYADWFDAERMFGVRDGFDIVIGNPPYVQLQKSRGELANRYKTADYETFARTGDIYQLFYERGCQLLKDGAHLCFITSNKWMRSEYGRKTRAFFAGKRPKILLDFGGFQVFESATVDTNVLLIENTAPREKRGRLLATAIRGDFKRGDDIAGYVAKNSIHLPRPGGDAWFIGTPAEFALKEKIERMGTPLKEWDISIYRGVITGLNEAFIVDNATRDALVAEDPRSKEILKPILRGRDIKRYRADWAGLWVIDAHNGYGDTPSINIDGYPAVKRHLDRFYPKMDKRQDQGQTPYNLRSCAYHAEFMRDKIVYPNMTKFLPFYYDACGRYFTNQKCFVVTSEENVLAYLTAFFNSSLFRCCFKDNFPALGADGRELSKIFMDKIPVKKPNRNQASLFKKLVIFAQLAKDRDEQEISKIIEEVIDACIMECYFPDDMRQSNLLFQADVSALFAAFDPTAPSSKQQGFIATLREIIGDPNHPIRVRLNTLATTGPDPLPTIKKRGKAM